MTQRTSVLATAVATLLVAAGSGGCVHNPPAPEPAPRVAAPRPAVPDFSGRWTPDTEKNPPGTGGGGGAGTGGGAGGMRGFAGSGDMGITQDTRRLTIVRTGPNGGVTTVYDLSGKKTRVATGTAETVTVARWAGGTLVVDRTVTSRTGSQVMTTRWYLEAGELVIEAATPPRGSAPPGVRKTYYRKVSQPTLTRLPGS